MLLQTYLTYFKYFIYKLNNIYIYIYIYIYIVIFQCKKECPCLIKGYFSMWKEVRKLKV